MSPEISSFLQKLLVNRSFLVWTDNCPMCKRRAALHLLLAPMALQFNRDVRAASCWGGMASGLNCSQGSPQVADGMSDQPSLRWRVSAFSMKHWMKIEQSWPWISASIIWYRLQHSGSSMKCSFSAMPQVLARVSSFNAESAVRMIKFWKKYSDISVCYFGRSFQDRYRLMLAEFKRQETPLNSG